MRFRDEDILLYDTESGSWSIYFDGSDVGLGSTDVDAFTIMPDGSLLLSISVAYTHIALGVVDDSDIIRFVPSSTGTDTQGSLGIYFDGSDVGLSSNGEDIKAISVDNNGNILISTTGWFVVGGLIGRDEDIFRFTPTSLGENTSGSWALHFDGSDVGMGDSSYEDIWGLSTDASGTHYLTTRRNYAIGNLSGGREDIIRCTPLSLGAETACTFEPVWIGSSHGFSGETLDGIHISTP